MRPDSSVLDKNAGTSDGLAEANQFSETKLGLSLLKNITLDQKAIWTAHRICVSRVPIGFCRLRQLQPFPWRRTLTFQEPDAIAFTGEQDDTFSNYGVGAVGGVTGGMYLLGRITHDDHEQEAGLLSGEAAVDAVGVTTVLQYSFGRQRPTEGSGEGGFWHGGTSFPSDHRQRRGQWQA